MAECNRQWVLHAKSLNIQHKGASLANLSVKQGQLNVKSTIFQLQSPVFAFLLCLLKKVIAVSYEMRNVVRNVHDVNFMAEQNTTRFRKKANLP